MIGVYDRNFGPACSCGQWKKPRAVRCRDCAREHAREYHAAYDAACRSTSGVRTPVTPHLYIQRACPASVSTGTLDKCFPWLRGCEAGL